MNGILKEKKHILTSSQNPVRFMNFKNFVAAEKSKLRTAYPFLCADQINRKIKEKWKQQHQSEQRQYTKEAVKVPHQKWRPRNNIKELTKRQKKIDVCETPEYVNPFKLHDFRKQHTESYKNDFKPDESSGLQSEDWTSTKIKKCEGRGFAKGASSSSATCEIPDKVPIAFRHRQDVNNNIVVEQMDTCESESLQSDEDEDGILIRRRDFDDIGDVVTEMSVEEKVFDLPKNGNEGNGKCDDVHFKSPNPKAFLVEKDAKKGSRQRGAANLTTPELLSTMQGASTPRVNNTGEETYTTPQMDEVLQKMTINEAKKAPQKQRYSYDSVNHSEKMKAVESGRRVTRSLVIRTKELNVDGKELDITDRMVVNGKKTGKFVSKKKQRLSLKSMKKIKDFTDVKGQCNNDVEHLGEAEKPDGGNFENTILKPESTTKKAKTSKRKSQEKKRLEVGQRTLQMNPFGDASQNEKESGEIVDSYDMEKMEVIDQIEANTKRLNNKVQVSKSSENVNKNTRHRITSLEFREKNDNGAKDDFSPGSSLNSGGESLSSFQCGSSPASSTRSQTSLKSSRKIDSTNPALERILQCLQSTRVTSPSWSCSNSSASSPSLLSPVLSGVSEPKKKKYIYPAESNSNANSRFVWARFRGVPCWWPARVILGDQIYVKCDNALLFVKSKDTMPFPGNFDVIEQQGLEILKQKNQKKTLECFLADIQWAQDKYEEHSQEQETTNTSPDVSCAEHSQEQKTTKTSPDISYEEHSQEQETTKTSPDVSYEEHSQEQETTKTSPDVSYEEHSQEQETTKTSPDVSFEEHSQDQETTKTSPDVSYEEHSQEQETTKTSPDVSCEEHSQEQETTKTSPDVSCEEHSQEQETTKTSPDVSCKEHSQEQETTKTSPDVSCEEHSQEQETTKTSPDVSCEEHSQEQETTKTSPDVSCEEHSQEQETTKTSPDVSCEEQSQEQETTKTSPDVSCKEHSQEQETTKNSPDVSCEEHSQEQETTKTSPDVSYEEHSQEQETTNTSPDVSCEEHSQDQETTKTSPDVSYEEHSQEQETTKTSPDVSCEEHSQEQETTKTSPDVSFEEHSQEQETTKTSPDVSCEEHSQEQETTKTSPDVSCEEHSQEQETTKTSPDVSCEEHSQEQETTKTSPDVSCEEHSQEQETTKTCPDVSGEEHSQDQETTKTSPDVSCEEHSQEQETTKTSPDVSCEEHSQEQETTKTSPDVSCEEHSQEQETTKTSPDVSCEEHSQEQETTKTSPDVSCEEHSQEQETTKTSPDVSCEEHSQEQETTKTSPDVSYEEHSQEQETTKTSPDVSCEEHSQDQETTNTSLCQSSESEDDASDYITDSESECQTSTQLLTIPQQSIDDGCSYIKEKHIIRDINQPGIYIRKVRKSNSSSRAQAQVKKEGNTRVNDNFHACLYCGKMRQHIKTHIKSHKHWPEVNQLLKEENLDINKIRKLGDHKNNKKVIRTGMGEILLSRRPERVLDIAAYGPCKICKEWVLCKNLKRHVTKCSPVKVHLSKRQLIIQSQVEAGIISNVPSKLMLNEVFPCMRMDDVGQVAQKDTCIVALGESWLRRSIDNKEKRKYYASQHMRLMAKLLIEIRSLDQDSLSANKEFADYLMTKYFDIIVAAALECCAPYMDDLEDLQSPSNGIKIKYDLQRMLTARWAMLVKADPHCNLAKEVQTCQQLVNVEWAEKIVKLSRTVLVRRSLTMKKELPSPEDVQKLTQYIISELKNVSLSVDNYSRIVKLSQTRLLMYNKRRSGELEAIRLESYAGKTRDIDEIDQSMVEDLTKVEKYLLKSQYLMKVRGKGNRPVPVLIPADTQKSLDYIASRTARREAGIPEDNLYLFPNSGQSHARAYSSLKNLCDECLLAYPGRITSVSLRKYTATLTQMLNLDQYQIDWVCRHLGHSSDVHKAHYRQMSGLVERVYVTKMLLLQDMNLTKKFKGKGLDEIDLTEMLFPDSELGKLEDNEDVLLNAVVGDMARNERDDEPVDRVVFEDDNDGEQDDMESEEEEEPPRQRNICKKKVVRQRWDQTEVEEIHKYFQSYLDAKVTPRANEVTAAKKKSKSNEGKLWKRSNDKIVKKISAMNHKK